MIPHPELDDVTASQVARYLSGEASPEEIAVMERRLAESNKLREQVTALHALWQEVADRRPRFDLDAMWRTIAPHVAGSAGSSAGVDPSSTRARCVRSTATPGSLWPARGAQRWWSSV